MTDMTDTAGQDYESLDELRSDCAAIPTGLHDVEPSTPLPRAAPAWAVDEQCHATAAEMDVYI